MYIYSELIEDRLKNEIAELLKQCVNLHNRYQYQEEKDNLQKFVEIDPEELSNFIETYSKTEKYNNREAEVFHSLSSILMEKQQDNAIMKSLKLKKAIENEEAAKIMYAI